MTARIEKTVFISYRRTNLPWALAIFQNLKNEGYDVFFDYLSIPSGDFENIIVENIKARAHFVVILTPSALERCNEPRDWLRREIETAIDEKRNIVPLMLESFDFGSPSTTKALTGKLEKLRKYNGLRLHSEYFFEGLNRLREQFLNVSLDAVVHPIIESAKPVTEEHQVAATDAPPVEKEQLTAQTWFERGYVFQNNGNLDEALRCYTEAICLDPNLDWAHNNLGAIFATLKRYDEAEAAYRKAIELNPSNDKAYVNLGNLLSDENQQRYKESEDAFRKAIEINPTLAETHSNLGVLLETLKRYDEAETAYRKASEYNPTLTQALLNLAALLRKLKRYNEAHAIYQKIIDINSNNFESFVAILSIDKLLNIESPSEYIAKARQLIPDDDWYNRACLECICDNFGMAFEYLRKAVQQEGFNAAWTWEDPDLQWIRKDPRFTEIIGEKLE